MNIEKIKTVLIFFLIAALLPAGLLRYKAVRDPYAREIPVFTYHRICPDEAYGSFSREKDLWTKAGDFEKEMRWLHRHGYRTVSMDELRRTCPELEFQSHSYGLHHDSNKNAVIYRTKYPWILKDFRRQEKLLGKGVDVIAYPYGYRTEGFEKAARKSGYRMAFLYGQQRGVRRSDPLFSLPRIGVRGDVDPEVAFFRWLEDDQ